MDKEKEIEKIANLIDDDIPPKLKAGRLLYAGYGNVKQAVKEFAEKLKKCFPPMTFGYMCLDVWELIDNLIKEIYGED